MKNGGTWKNQKWKHIIRMSHTFCSLIIRFKFRLFRILYIDVISMFLDAVIIFSFVNVIVVLAYCLAK